MATPEEMLVGAIKSQCQNVLPKKASLNETRRLFCSDLWGLCNKKGWYTEGTNEEYRLLFDFVETLNHVTTEDIIAIATDIIDHSDTEYTVSAACFEIARICLSFFE